MKMREVKVTKPGATPAAKSTKAPKTTSYINADGIKVTVCHTVFKEPKRLTARC